MAAISRLWTDPEVRRYLGGPVAEQQVAARERGCAGYPGAFSVVRASDESVIGMVSVGPDSRWGARAEVSYQLLPEYWGHGYAREAVAPVVSWALRQVGSGLPCVVTVTQEANVRSRRLLESIGMRLMDTFVEWDAPQTMYSVDRAGLRLAE